MLAESSESTRRGYHAGVAQGKVGFCGAMTVLAKVYRSAAVLTCTCTLTRVVTILDPDHSSFSRQKMTLESERCTKTVEHEVGYGHDRYEEKSLQEARLLEVMRVIAAKDATDAYRM
jgi:hypothetical protein